MGPTLPWHLARAGEADVGLVDEGGGAQGVSRPFGEKLLLGSAAELVVHGLEEGVEGAGLTGVRGGEQSRGVGGQSVRGHPEECSELARDVGGPGMSTRVVQVHQPDERGFMFGSLPPTTVPIR